MILNDQANLSFNGLTEIRALHISGFQLRPVGKAAMI